MPDQEKTRDWTKDRALAPTAVAAIGLAIKGAADAEVAVRLISAILEMTYTPSEAQAHDGGDLFLAALRNLGGKFELR